MFFCFFFVLFCVLVVFLAESPFVLGSCAHRPSELVQSLWLGCYCDLSFF